MHLSQTYWVALSMLHFPCIVHWFLARRLPRKADFLAWWKNILPASIKTGVFFLGKINGELDEKQKSKKISLMDHVVIGVTLFLTENLISIRVLHFFSQKTWSRFDVKSISAELWKLFRARVRWNYRRDDAMCASRCGSYFGSKRLLSAHTTSHLLFW